MQELPGHPDDRTSMIDTHNLNRSVRKPANGSVRPPAEHPANTARRANQFVIFEQPIATIEPIALERLSVGRISLRSAAKYDDRSITKLEVPEFAVIDRTKVVTMLIGACPSFRQSWERYVSSVDYDNDLVYLHLGEYARHLVDLYTSRDTSEFAAVFCVVEELHIHGDSYVREAATIGLLETLQNITENRGLDAAVIVPFLGPESALWWDKLNRFWSGDSSALQD